jgi:cytochrome c oxidase subunit II
MTARNKARLAKALVGGLALALLLLTACTRTHIPQDTLNPAGDPAHRQAGLYWLVFWIAAGVFVLVEGLLMVALFRWRHRPGRGVPRQVHGNRVLEIAWTIAPAVILAGIAVPTVADIFSLSHRPAGNVLDIEVVGHQWWWEVHYPGLGIVTANEIHVPVRQEVYVSMTSAGSGAVDPGAGVIHSFWIPRLAGKQDLEPGHTTHVKFSADTPGVYLGQCAEYCGTSHANMRFRVMADTPAAFDAWVAQQQQKAQPADAAALSALQTGGCGGCHVIDGVDGMVGTVGPNLTHFGIRTTFAGAILRVTDDNLRAWLRDPQAVKPGNDMYIGAGGKPGRSVLSEDQIDVLVRYLRGLK